MQRWKLLSGLLFMLLVTTACAPNGFLSDRGMEEDAFITGNDLPDEKDKQSIINSINENSHQEIDDLIEANFPLMDVVSGDRSKAEIYATDQFTLTELADVLTTATRPEKISEVKDDQQIFIYPDDFVTLKRNEEDEDVLLIEVAEDEFVRRNYSPNLLGTYFAFRLLDNIFGNNWSNRRAQQCSAGDCYGGYTRGGYFPNGTPKRGNSTFRGGGPGAGK